MIRTTIDLYHISFSLDFDTLSLQDIRVHFVSRLAAVDTAERDRAVAELQQSRAEQRELELRHSELQVFFTRYAFVRCTDF